MDHETLGLEIAKRFLAMGVSDKRCLELAMAKAEEVVTKNLIATRNVETISNWVRAHYPQWFGAAPGTVAITPAPAPQPVPSAPTSNPAPKGKKKGEAAQSAPGPADSSTPPEIKGDQQ